jgi:peptidoglycan hydrolase-like protein with peptidoglycan-binding domain
MDGPLRKGARGAEVQELQAALNFHIRKPAEPLKPDGDFGRLTDARLREFQRRAKITESGVATDETLRRLYRRQVGAIEAVLTPKPQLVAFSRLARAGTGSRSALRGGIPGLGQVGPVIPDFVPPSLRIPQTRAAVSRGFDFETKFSFDPMAKPSEGEHPLKLTIAWGMPWPKLLGEEVKLEVTPSSAGKFTLEGKVKVPFNLVETPRFELKPYFFTGGGVNQNHFKDLNAGASASVKLKLIENTAGTIKLSVEADGGLKFNWDVPKGESGFKGFFEGTAVLEARF